MNKRQSGFTLIEIMVVVVILGILAALVVPQVMSRPDQAKVTVAKGDIKAVAAALDMYKLDNHAYPSTQQGLEAGLRVGNADDLHARDGWRALEVIGVCHQDAGALRVQLLQLEGAGAGAGDLDRIARVHRDDHEPVVGQDQRHVGKGCVQHKLDGLGVHRLDGLDHRDGCTHR